MTNRLKSKLMDNELQSGENAEYEAAVWIIRLAEEPDNVELKAEYKVWRNKNECNANIFDDMQAANELIENTEPATRKKWGKSWKANNTSRTRFLTTRRLNPLFAQGRKITLAVALTCCLVIVIGPLAKLHLQADYQTATAEQKTIILSDGSQINLAPESAISVDFSMAERRVQLLQGRAFFSISPDPQRPFSVKAGATQATVLGTAFAVQLTDDSAIVTVKEGHVRVSDSSLQPVLSEELYAGERISVSWHEKAKREQVVADNVALWRRGEWVVHNQLISELVDTLGSYYQGAIIVQSPRFSNLRVSGLYKLNTPISTLKSLADAHGAVVRQISPWLLVVSDE